MTQIIAKATGAPINVISTDENGSPFSLQSATAVVLNVLYPDNETRKSLNMNVQSAQLKDDNNNILADAYFWAQYRPATSDFMVDGEYPCQAVATFVDGDVPCSTFTLAVGKRI